MSRGSLSVTFRCGLPPGVTAGFMDQAPRVLCTRTCSGRLRLLPAAGPPGRRPSLGGGRRGGGGAAWIWGGVRGKASVCAPTQPASSYCCVTRAGTPTKAQVSALKSRVTPSPGHRVDARRKRPRPRPWPLPAAFSWFISLILAALVSSACGERGLLPLAAPGSLMAVAPLVAELRLWTGAQAPQSL